MSKYKIILILGLILMTNSSYALGSRAGIDSSSWSMLYGYSENQNKDSYKPTGYSYKFQFGNRWSNGGEINFVGRYSYKKDDITYSNINGSIARSDLTGALLFGYWIFPFMKLHTGYAIHIYRDTITGNYTSNQTSNIKDSYGLTESTVKGLFAGADIVIFQTNSFQLFANYDYYHLNHMEAHDWDAMLGIRIYPGSGSKGSSTPGWFTKFLDWIVKSDSK